jgi:hypothetical protein
MASGSLRPYPSTRRKPGSRRVYRWAAWVLKNKEEPGFRPSPERRAGVTIGDVYGVGATLTLTTHGSGALPAVSATTRRNA